MGRLAGFRDRDVVQLLKTGGFEFDRQAAGSHRIFLSADEKGLCSFRLKCSPDHTHVLRPQFKPPVGVQVVAPAAPDDGVAEEAR
jgi:HicA toxin of bacterial toxin-antitoxin,